MNTVRRAQLPQTARISGRFLRSKGSVLCRFWGDGAVAVNRMNAQGWLEAGLKEGKVYCEVQKKKSVPSRRKKKKEVTQRTDVREQGSRQ